MGEAAGEVGCCAEAAGSGNRWAAVGSSLPLHCWAFCCVQCGCNLGTSMSLAPPRPLAVDTACGQNLTLRCCPPPSPQVCDALEDMMGEGGVLVDYHGCDFFPER